MKYALTLFALLMGGIGVMTVTTSEPAHAVVYCQYRLSGKLHARPESGSAHVRLRVLRYVRTHTTIAAPLVAAPLIAAVPSTAPVAR